ncbi:MAG: 2-amino-4-hydroxy-6-hydroxymethyldihydropteridine diphosphokinase [Deltaproteobacteria bacterium]|nr:MAG: 2-amino-4-hydroxy-6-hydroxymethyldihydropteridine diphosphokinase [Deltaproteobacteria bacterium]
MAVGSNLGDRLQNIQTVQQKLNTSEIKVLRTSPFYETQALCRPDQDFMPDFLNGVFEVKTSLSPEALLNAIEKIERDMGRTSKSDWSPRVIDLDILFYGDQIIDTAHLQIPHPEIQNRWFVLKPLSDLIPDFKHPLLLKTVQQLLSELT